MATSLDTRKKIAKAISSRQSFKFGNISGKWVTSNLSGWDSGRLPQAWRTLLNKTLEDCDVYVVFSYGTPVAWNSGALAKHTFTVPDVSYSPTTTHHQNVIAVAILPNSPYLSS